MAPAPAKAVLSRPAVGADRRAPEKRAPEKGNPASPGRDKDPQGRYGNAEVARVLALKQPLWVEKKDGGSLEELPEAGNVVAARDVKTRADAIKPGKPPTDSTK